MNYDKTISVSITAVYFEDSDYTMRWRLTAEGENLKLVGTGIRLVNAWNTMIVNLGTEGRRLRAKIDVNPKITVSVNENQWELPYNKPWSEDVLKVFRSIVPGPVLFKPRVFVQKHPTRTDKPFEAYRVIDPRKVGVGNTEEEAVNSLVSITADQEAPTSQDVVVQSYSPEWSPLQSFLDDQNDNPPSKPDRDLD